MTSDKASIKGRGIDVRYVGRIMLSYIAMRGGPSGRQERTKGSKGWQVWYVYVASVMTVPISGDLPKFMARITLRYL